MMVSRELLRQVRVGQLEWDLASGISLGGGWQQVGMGTRRWGPGALHPPPPHTHTSPGILTSFHNLYNPQWSSTISSWHHQEKQKAFCKHTLKQGISFLQHKWRECGVIQNYIFSTTWSWCVLNSESNLLWFFHTTSRFSFLAFVW